MGARDLFRRLRGSSFELSLTEHGGVKVTPASALTDDIRQAIRVNRAELVELLRGCGGTSPTPRHYQLSKADADHCHWPPWSEPEIAIFSVRVLTFIRRCMSPADADDLAESLTLRDRDGDDRRLCLECTWLGETGKCLAAASGRIAGADRRLEPMQTMLQRCPAFGIRKGLV
jgi:hypothetical protein